ncbi:iron-sulfur cluster assembly protein [Tamaricihabitans halophyticus]|nr:iron-sulfur cluster assembly protein [Tamaricihabitans halophyticus]
MTTTTAPSLHKSVLSALDTVRDPELDEPITELGFVQTIRLHTRGVEVTLRLPTYFCAPNFAYLMVADAYDAVAALPGVAEASIQLVDHFASAEINAGVAQQAGFGGTFPAQTDAELTELRQIFRRKAYLAALDRLCTALRGRGYEISEIAELRLGELPGGTQRDSLLRRRRELGMSALAHDWLLLDEEGTRITSTEAPLRLRFARAVRVSIEGNAGFCRGLLHTRYPNGEYSKVEPSAR